MKKKDHLLFYMLSQLHFFVTNLSKKSEEVCVKKQKSHKQNNKLLQRGTREWKREFCVCCWC